MSFDPSAVDVPVVFEPEPLQSLECQLREERDGARGQVEDLQARLHQVEAELLSARKRIAEMGELAAQPLEEVEPEPEHVPCLIFPREGMFACPEAVFGPGAPGGALHNHHGCQYAGGCHRTLLEKAPALVDVFERALRVEGP